MAELSGDFILNMNSSQHCN